MSAPGKIVRVLRQEGPRVLGARVLRKAAGTLAPAQETFPLLLPDIVAGRDAVPTWPRWRAVAATDRFVLNWVTTPPGPGSGGHTTMFRLIQYLESQGHECRLFLYDRYLGDVAKHEAVIRRWWPGVTAAVHDARLGLSPADAVFATSWPTAHIAAGSATPGKRFYLVQDFEPDFHPLGSERHLAELTYQFGFHAVTAGRWLAERLSADYGMTCDWFAFGCDTDIYRLVTQSSGDDGGPRNGVVFYAKPDVPRRAYILGLLALDLFARRHPGHEIHLFGHRSPRLPFTAIDHGPMTTRELNDLYNRCSAGLSLSLTNVSLIPWEMLASGCTPVVNDAHHNRIVLDNPAVKYAELAPQALADALGEVVDAPDQSLQRKVAAASVTSARWDEAGVLVESVLRRELPV